jgi:hypothetical protein
MKTVRTLTKVCIMSILAFALVAGFHTEAKAGDVAVKLRAPKKARECRDKTVVVTLMNNGTSDETISLYLYKDEFPNGRLFPPPYDSKVVDVLASSRVRVSFTYNTAGDAGPHEWQADIYGDSDASNNTTPRVFTETVPCK